MSVPRNTWRPRIADARSDDAGPQGPISSAAGFLVVAKDAFENEGEGEEKAAELLNGTLPFIRHR